MNWTIIVELIAGFWLVLLGLRMSTENSRSFVILSFIPTLLGGLTFFIALAHWQHWPIG